MDNILVAYIASILYLSFLLGVFCTQNPTPYVQAIVVTNISTTCFIITLVLCQSGRPIKYDLRENTVDEECAICLENIEEYPALQNCNHHFHAECLSDLMKSDWPDSCPLCRKTLVLKIV